LKGGYRQRYMRRGEARQNQRRTDYQKQNGVTKNGWTDGKEDVGEEVAHGSDVVRSRGSEIEGIRYELGEGENPGVWCRGD